MVHRGRNRVIQSSGRRYPLPWKHLKRLRTDAHLKHIIIKKNGKIMMITVVKIPDTYDRTMRKTDINNLIHAYFTR